MGQQHCIGVSLADSVEDDDSSDEQSLLTAHAQEVRKKVAALTDKYSWETDPEVEQALAQTDLPTYRRILERHRSAEPCWDESVHGAFSGDRRVQSLAVGGFVFENLSVYMVLVQLLHPALSRNGRPPRVLDVGCGTGFLTAVLARLVAPRGGSVVAIDLFARQVEHAQRTMSACCPELLPHVTFAVANGLDYKDPRGAPFDAIAVACQATEVPQGLVQQLAPGGHLVAPVGRLSLKDSGKARPHHKYWVVKKGTDGTIVFSGRAGPISVNFVPLLPSNPSVPLHPPASPPAAGTTQGRAPAACPAGAAAAGARTATPRQASAPAAAAAALGGAASAPGPGLSVPLQVGGIQWPVPAALFPAADGAPLRSAPYAAAAGVQVRGAVLAGSPAYGAPWSGVRPHLGSRLP